MQLETFTPDAAATVVGWATTPDEVMAWCSHPEAPVRPETLIGWSRSPTVVAHLLVERETPVAYGELWLDDEESEVELSRLIVAPDHRGRGVGRFLVAALTERARHHFADVFLRVRPDNETARRCYERAGFTRVDLEDEALWNQGQPTNYVWMVAPPRSEEGSQ